MAKASNKQLLHIVVGGELVDPAGTEFRDLTKLDFVGAYPDLASAHAAWRGAAQRTVDSALTRYFIIDAHKLMNPDTDRVE